VGGVHSRWRSKGSQRQRQPEEEEEGGREDGDVKEVADDKEQLSPAAIVADDNHERNETKGSLLNEDLALSNDVVVSDDKQSYDLNFIFPALSLLFWIHGIII